MEKTTVTPEQYLVHKAIFLAKLEEKDLSEYSSQELFKITEQFQNPKMLKMKDRFGSQSYQKALNRVSFAESDLDADLLGI